MSSAIELKEKGNAEYKVKNFTKALEYYNQALEIEPKNVNIKLNITAVELETGEYDKCIEECIALIDLAKEEKQYDMLYKIYVRIGNAYFKQEKYQESIEYYKKSLTEKRIADTLNKLNLAEKKLKEKIEKDNYNPELAKELKDKGNEHFKKMEYPEAIKMYSEAIIHDPNEAVLYSNRCACYQKLGEIPSALKDAEKAIQVNPRFVKGYTRKAACHYALKEYHKAIQAYNDALKVEPNNVEALEGLRNVERESMGASNSEDSEERARRAQADPEIQAIMRDPVMQSVLQDLSSGNQEVIQKHLSNPIILERIQKLVAAGVIRFG